MVNMTTSVKLDRIAELNNLGHVLLRHRILQLFLRRVQIRDVRVVMLLVVKLHDFAANDRLESAEIVRQIRQRVLASAAQHGAAVLCSGKECSAYGQHYC